MVLSYHGFAVEYDQLLTLLRIGPGGAPFRHLHYLEQLGVTVTIQQGSFPQIQSHIINGHPPILFVDTGELPYWPTKTNHAMVISGFDDSSIFLHDPAFDHFPIAVNRQEFDLAWLSMDEWYAMIRPTNS